MDVEAIFFPHIIAGGGSGAVLVLDLSKYSIFAYHLMKYRW